VTQSGEKYCTLFCIGENLHDVFPIQNGLKQGDDLMPLLFTSALEYGYQDGARKLKDWN
jgi:hypothetical protein